MTARRCRDDSWTDGIEAAVAPEALQRWLGELDEDIREIIAMIESCCDGQGRRQRAWIVGGAVRDAASGLTPADVDIATTMGPAELLELFPRAIGTGARYGTIFVRHKHASAECSVLRTGEGNNGSRLDVVLASTLLEDLAFRDFTVNAMALDATRGLLYDPFGGLADIAARVLRAVSRPALRTLEDDGLRTLRAYRFMGTHAEGPPAWTLHQELAHALTEAPPLLERISGERIRKELMQILGGPLVPRVLRRMAKDGVLQAALRAGQRLQADGRELRALDALWQNFPLVTASTVSSEAFGDSSAGLAQDGEGEVPYSKEQRAVEGLALLLAQFPEQDVERVCKALKLNRVESNFICGHLKSLGCVPDAGDIGEVRRFLTFLGGGTAGRTAAAARWRLEQAWAAGEKDPTERMAGLGRVAGAAVTAAALRPGSVAPRPLANGHWLKERTCVPDFKLGLLKDWLYYVQVDRDIETIEELQTYLDGIDLAADNALSHLQRISWPPGSSNNRLSHGRQRGKRR